MKKNKYLTKIQFYYTLIQLKHTKMISPIAISFSLSTKIRLRIYNYYKDNSLIWYQLSFIHFYPQLLQITVTFYFKFVMSFLH